MQSLINGVFAFDRTKQPAAKIPHYWIVNLIDGCVECYSRPQSGRRPEYRRVETFTKNDLLLLVLDGKKYGELAVSQLMS